MRKDLLDSDKHAKRDLNQPDKNAHPKRMVYIVRSR
jgi:hypothetical protein